MRHAAYGKAVEDDPIDNFVRYRDVRWRLVGLNLNVLVKPGANKSPKAPALEQR